MTYMIPLVCSMEYFPDHKGLVTGIIVGSYGLGSFIFNLVATKIVNPSGASADLHTPDPNLTLFRPAVANRVPTLLRILCAVWACLVLIAASLISKPSPEASANGQPESGEITEEQLHQNQNTIQPRSSSSATASVSDDKTDRDSLLAREEKPDSILNLISPYSCRYSVRFWQYFAIMFLSNVFGGFFSYQYKTIYESHHSKSKDADIIMAWAASAAGIVQFITRISVGHLYDRLGFKPILNALMAINIANAMFCYQLKMLTVPYVACIELNYLVLGGIFAVFPAPVIKTFGIYYGP
jgi:MFS family permease